MVTELTSLPKHLVPGSLLLRTGNNIAREANVIHVFKLPLWEHYTTKIARYMTFHQSVGKCQPFCICTIITDIHSHRYVNIKAVL